MEANLILIPTSKNLSLYFENRRPCSVVCYEVGTSSELLKLVSNYVNFTKIKEWIIDTKLDCSELLSFLNKRQITTTLVDNKTNSRFLTDKNIYPTPLFEKDDLDWNGYMGTIKGGLEQMQAFLGDIKAPIKQEKSSNKVLISFGGEDPKEVTLHTMKSLVHLDSKIKLVVVIGPYFKHRDKIYRFNESIGHRFELIENCYDLLKVICNSDCLITAVGTTLFEAMALETPSVVISNYRNDLSDETKLTKFKNVTVLGNYKKIIQNEKLLLGSVMKYLESSS